MDISVIIPLYNEAESLPELTAWIERVMNENKFTYEIIFINDGHITDVGTHDELYERCSDYRDMVELQKLDEEKGGEADE